MYTLQSVQALRLAEPREQTRMDLSKRYHTIGDRSELSNMMMEKSTRNITGSLFNATEALLKERLGFKKGPKLSKRRDLSGGQSLNHLEQIDVDARIMGSHLT